MEAVLIALKAIEERDEAIEARRANERDRKRRQRARAEDDCGTVTGQSRDEDGTDELAPSLSRPFPPQTPPYPTHTHPEIQPRARKGHRLPLDWQPKPLPAEVAAIVARWPEGAIERELARFRDWAKGATGKSALKNDWDAAWRNWLRRRDDEGTYKRNDNRKSSSTASAAAGALARLTGACPPG
ncbi:hypothetical protein [Tsuneonella sp. HG222]